MTMLATHADHASIRSVPARDLDSLARMSFRDLDAAYRSATAPASMRAADGALRGRMLAVRGVRGPLAARLTRWAGSSSFVWEGKTFTSSSDTAGIGHNRVRVDGVLGRQNLFPFATRFDASALDGRRALVLDYDLAVNPPYIRRIHDEVREVEPGLLLGPAMWKRGDDKVLVLWFALDARSA
jgi:hypothetical protein